MTDTPISQVLKVLMFQKNVKTTQLARELDLPQQTLQRIVSGASPRPHRSSLEPIANYFEISIAQLKGEEPLPDKLSSITLSPPTQTCSIPLLPWELLIQQPNSKPQASDKQIIMHKAVNAECFAAQLNDTSMEPYFPQQAILIFDPDKTPKDRSYVLANLNDKQTTVFRQLIIDGDNQCTPCVQDVAE